MCNNKVYLIGEIGQNHNGSVELAKKLVDLAGSPGKADVFGNSFSGMDAVKLTKRDLRCELSASAYDQPYRSAHSFGRTYGEHREALELTEEEHHEVFLYAKAKGLDFIETLCAPSCLSLLRHFTPDFLKVASRDLTHLPLVERMAETKLPMILSTGMAGKKELDQALEVITRYHEDIAILHCVSQYPTRPENVNLNSIAYLKEHYGQYRIGYSDHTIGISVPVAAVAMGARIIEKHITVDRKLKGTDQAGSLGPDGILRMVRDVRLLERSFGKKAIFIDPAVGPGKLKLERSLASKRFLPKGMVLTQEDIHMLSPGGGISWGQRDQVIGKTLLREIPANELLDPRDFIPEETKEKIHS